MTSLVNPVRLRRRVCLDGIVQGVGFRPFVYKLAKRIGISGFILNSSSGVTIEAEGVGMLLDQFLEAMRRELPPLARIEHMTSAELEPVGDEGFEIRESQAAIGRFALVAPDMASCEECLGDVSEPGNRRFGYPFTNCTNCGPRYTIIRDIPYDRPLTTMVDFRMCEDCEAEYRDPTNRRFHAQPNACPACGPTITLAKSGPCAAPDQAREFGDSSLSALREVRRLLHEGAIVGIKGLGGFQLACDAENSAAVRLLRRRKKRSDKPFALMARDETDVEKFCIVSERDRELLLSAQRPVVILPRRQASCISPDVAPGNKTIGVMLAYTPLHLLLFGDQPNAASEFTALVMTSGNISDEPIVISNTEAHRRLVAVADWFLVHDRGIHMRVDDSVARVFDDRPRVLRRSRGYAPHAIDLGPPLCELLACGAELKNTFCLTKDRYAILSQHIGDVDNYETLEFFDETLANLKKLFRVEPKAVAHDLHPGYLTSRFASGLALPAIGVQHHHAHIVSCMAENRIQGKVIGVAMDGTGYGTDGQIWGGEFLVADAGGFERWAHLRYVPLAGGDAAVRQPWRSALSWLRGTLGSELPGDLALFHQVPPREIAVVTRMMDRGVNTVLTSSCGRLFDAVAAMIGLRREVTFEGQAATELEMAARPDIEDAYPFEIDSREPAQIDMRPAILEIVRDLRSLDARTRKAKEVIASRFHNTVATVIAEGCRRIREREHLNRVCLSGGTFQNIYLLRRATALLRNMNFEVFLHAAVPPNDGGISLGQAVIANHILNSGA